MSRHRGKVAALAATATMGELFAECKQQAEISPVELQEILEEIHVYLIQQAAVKLDDIPIDTEQLKLDKEAKRSLFYKARKQVRLPDRPKINKMWIVKPTIRARLPIH